jgi:hypothetical protein
MAETSEAKRQYWQRWSNRVLIIVIGLSLGLGARWIKKAWQASQRNAPASSAPATPLINAK